MKKGIWLAIGAYCWWGFLPLYLKMLRLVPVMQIIGHRIVWSFLLLLLVLLLMNQWIKFRKSAFVPRVFGIYAIASLLIGINWLTYVFAINSGQIVEASLGYFINPLLSVFMGVIFFREHLRSWQWISIFLMLIGVLYLTFAIGSLPWVAIILAFSFALYGLVKKVAPLSSLYGMLLETGILLLPAIAYLVITNNSGDGTFLHLSVRIDLLLIGAGLVTIIPLLLFASAAQRISLTIIGILQFLAPTLQFLIGVLVYHEPFTHKQFLGYSFVWAALALFCVEGYINFRKQANTVKLK